MTTIPEVEPNKTYEYHDGAMGHNIENYHSFKDKFLRLIKAGWITFNGQEIYKDNTKG